MGEAIDLRALMEEERLILASGVDTRKVVLKTHNEFQAEWDEEWQRMFAAEAAQRQALTVARQVGPLLDKAGVTKDMRLFEDQIVVVPRRFGRDDEFPDRVTKAEGWLLRDGIDNRIVKFDRWSLGGQTDAEDAVAVDETGGLHIVPFGSGPGVPRVNQIMNIFETRYSDQWIISDHSWQDLITNRQTGEVPKMQWGLSKNDIEDVERKARIATAAIPYMARMLVSNNIELTPSFQ